MKSGFLNLLRWQLNVDAGKLLKWFAASFFINLVLLLTAAKLYANIDGIFSDTMSDVVTYSLNFSLLQLALLYPLTRLLAPMVSMDSRVAFMSLPVSHGRKFWMRVLFLGVVCAVVWVVGFIMADAVQVLIAKMTSGTDGQWALPAMMDNVQRTLLPAQSPREVMVGVLNAMDFSRHAPMSPDSLQAMQASMEGWMEDTLQVRTFAEAGWEGVCYGVSSLLLSASACLLCGALFRNVPWVFALIASFVSSPLLMVLDYLFNLGMGGLAIIFFALTIIFMYLAYNIFRKTQVINNKLLNV